jgi:hypothetical protein
MNRIKLALVLAIALTALFSTSAFADQMTGGYAIAGGFSPVDASGDPASIATATSINFDPNTFTVIARSGSFASFVPVGSTGTIQDFTFSGPGGAIPATPIYGFQQVGGFTFDLLEISSFSQDADTLTVHGLGVFTGNGFDATSGNFVFTGQGNTWGDFSFSASEGTTNVPEPASLGLAAAGLASAGFFRRRKQA